jgi:hypothetical protein
MPLNNDQMNKVRAHFRLNGVVLDCVYCSVVHGWEGVELVSAPVVDEGGRAHPENPTMTMVQFSCKNCGHVTLFDARAIGLVGR